MGDFSLELFSGRPQTHRTPTGKNVQVFGMFASGFWFVPAVVKSACTINFNIILKNILLQVILWKRMLTLVCLWPFESTDSQRSLPLIWLKYKISVAKYGFGISRNAYSMTFWHLVDGKSLKGLWFLRSAVKSMAQTKAIQTCAITLTLLLQWEPWSGKGDIWSLLAWNYRYRNPLLQFSLGDTLSLIHTVKLH